ncbi:hypothetical protein LPTSP4_25050 [Leptospira ryugenii]|uniref:TPM domain-containing protein n=1 Tax=Leptospira ryugenii TaxID=1917863 RepID=A0A2P2E2A8_9LEPT|nr:TPM domain-containing protein [Leptospira ryugenii]GBF50974.1 hypothetical protein LPTSP4_25050 [Leptospira ryugenii]
MRKVYCLLLFILVCFQCKASLEDLPKLTSPIMDPKGVLSNTAKTELESLLRKNEADTTNQIVVYLEDSLMFGSIEEDAIKIFEAWKLGKKEKDNGILLLFAMKERKVRIEVGYGLEGVFTDLAAKRIINEIIAPNMKLGNYEQAIKQGTIAILSQTNASSLDYISKYCPEAFVDRASWIHEDTIPLLQKEIQTRGLKNQVNFRFCVTASYNQLHLDGLALGILKNIPANGKPSFVLLASKFLTENGYSYRGFGGSIAVSPELSPLFSQMRNIELFQNLYEEASHDDMTNYSYRAYLSALDRIEPYVVNKNQIPKEYSKVHDPNGVLSTFAIENITKLLDKMFNEDRLKVSLSIIKTRQEIETDVQKVLNQTLGTENGILVVYSLNERKFLVRISKKFLPPIAGNAKIQFNKSQYESMLTKLVRKASEGYLSEGDLNWAMIRALESISTSWNTYHPEEDLSVTDKQSATKEETQSFYPTIELPFLWVFFRVCLLLVLISAFASANGVIFLSVLFYYASIYLRDWIPSLKGFSHLTEIFLLGFSTIAGYLSTLLFRSVGIAKIIEDFIGSTSDGFSSNSQSTTTIRSSSYSSSSSSSTSSSSSYSGGGGSSGGGGASGSW